MALYLQARPRKILLKGCPLPVSKVPLGAETAVRVYDQVTRVSTELFDDVNDTTQCDTRHNDMISRNESSLEENAVMGGKKISSDLKHTATIA